MTSTIVVGGSLYSSVSATDYDAFHAIVVGGLASIREREWQVGAALAKIKQLDLWLQAGLDSFDQYCGQPEVDISLTRARRYIRAWERFGPFVQEGRTTMNDLADLGTTKADMIGPAIDRDPSRAEEWIDKGKNLTKGDLKKELRRDDPTHPQRDHAAALAFLEDVSTKLCSMAGRLPDQADPYDHLLKLAQSAQAAASEWSEVYA